MALVSPRGGSYKAQIRFRAIVRLEWQSELTVAADYRCSIAIAGLIALLVKSISLQKANQEDFKCTTTRRYVVHRIVITRAASVVPVSNPSAHRTTRAIVPAATDRAPDWARSYQLIL